jgi:hypothetical protein
MKQTKIISKLALASAKIFYRYLAVGAEVFCRHSFGVRYVNELAIGFVIFFFYAATIGNAIPRRFPFLEIYLDCYLVLVCYHVISIFRRRNQIVHSHSAGLPWPFWRHLNVKPLVLDLLLEPGSLLLIGILIFRWDGALAVWLQLSALSLFVKRAISEWFRWHHLMDVLDTRIEGEMLNETVRARTAPRSRTVASNTTPVTAGQITENPGRKTRIHSTRFLAISIRRCAGCLPMATEIVPTYPHAQHRNVPSRTATRAGRWIICQESNPLADNNQVKNYDYKGQVPRPVGRGEVTGTR